MNNCKLDSLRGYSYRLPNTILNSGHLVEGGFLMPLANSIQLFDGAKASTIYETKREINAMDLRGSLLALGEKASPGQLISAILLDIRNLDSPRQFNFQKTQIDLISVSPDGEFIVSIGSQSQDIQELNIIQVNNQSQIGTRVFYSKKFKRKDGKAVCLKFSHQDPTFFVVMCASKVTFFHIDIETEAIEEIEVKTSKIREYNSFVFSPDDHFLYGCSKNGDIAEIDIDEGKQTRIGPKRRVITKGITHIQHIQGGFLCICGKEGMIAIIELQTFKIVKEFKLEDQQIVSLSEFQDGQAYISTNRACIYHFKPNKGSLDQIYICHTTQINALATIKDYQGLFGTSSGGDIILWNTQELSPILKISLPKLSCLSLFFPKTGKHIISGWNDDCIRIFSPKNGKLAHRITPTNLGKVRVIISDDDSTKIICGGENGVIRMWNIMQSKDFGLILGSLAFHSKPVHSLRINPWNPNMLASCCEDGQLAVWNLKAMQIMRSFFVCNFIKEIHFLSSTQIQVAGAGSLLYNCLVSSGSVVKQIQLNGTCINTFVHCSTDFTKQQLLFFGGDTHYLQYFEYDQANVNLHRLQSYGSIVKIAMTANKDTLLAITENGIILSYKIFPSTKN